MSDLQAIYKRYTDEANRYASMYGLDPTTANTDGHWDAFRHAYASAAMTREYGQTAAHVFGDMNEVRGDLAAGGRQRSYSKHMDRWNNAVGRRLAEDAADNDEIAGRVHSALKGGDLIIDVDQDARYYTGPTWVPSPYDFSNRIDKRSTSAQPGAAVATGSSSATLGINPHRYYGPYVGGMADIQAPEDHPLSPEEIERMRRASGIPKGGLF